MYYDRQGIANDDSMEWNRVFFFLLFFFFLLKNYCQQSHRSNQFTKSLHKEWGDKDKDNKLQKIQFLWILFFLFLFLLYFSSAGNPIHNNSRRKWKTREDNADDDNEDADHDGNGCEIMLTLIKKNNREAKRIMKEGENWMRIKWSKEKKKEKKMRDV